MNILEVISLSRKFGGIAAVSDLSFSIRQNAIYSIIGPNGAGKTTLLNLITGFYQPSEGSIKFESQNLLGRAIDERARLGVTRTFQNLQICMNMTAIENVMLGMHQHLESGFVQSLLRLPSLVRRDLSCRAEAAALMDFVGLGEYVDANADSLPYGALKRLEIARSLASKPRLLLLDEPAAGLNAIETAQIGRLIQELSKSGLTVVLVDHDMPLVMSVSDQVIVLNYGQKIAEGTVEEIKRHPEVVAAYLGTATK